MLRLAKKLKSVGHVREARRVLLATLLLRRLWWKRDKRRAMYLAEEVRDRGIWRDWRRAGLKHLSDAAMIRFCGFPKAVCLDLARRLEAVFPKLRFHTPAQPNPIWFRQNKPICDLLDIVVLKLREVATVGYQHQLMTDMGIPRTSLWKYLKMGTKGLSDVLVNQSHPAAHPSAKVGLFETEAEARAAFHALESSYGKCPMMGLLLSYFFDGTAARCSPPNDETRDQWWVGSKGFYGTNSTLLTSSFGLVHWYHAGLPGAVNDLRAGKDIFDMLQDLDYNPWRAGCIVDYGLHAVCTHAPGRTVITRPFCPGKDVPFPGNFPEAREWRHLVAKMSAWVCSCRQSNEWVNGDAKKGFPRWQMLVDARWAERLKTDLKLFLHLYNLRVRVCDWGQTREVFRDAINEHFRDMNLTYDPVTGEVIHPDGPRAEPGGGGDDDEVDDE